MNYSDWTARASHLPRPHRTEGGGALHESMVPTVPPPKWLIEGGVRERRPRRADTLNTVQLQPIR